MRSIGSREKSPIYRQFRGLLILRCISLTLAAIALEGGGKRDVQAGRSRSGRGPRVALRLGATRPGRPGPPPDLHRPGDLPRGDDENLRRRLGLPRPREPAPAE